MSDDKDAKNDGSADRIPSESSEKSQAAERVARFAQYTSPAMIAMLASSGKAFAQSLAL